MEFYSFFLSRAIYVMSLYIQCSSEFKVYTHVLVQCNFMHSHFVGLLVRNVLPWCFAVLWPRHRVFITRIFYMILSYKNFARDEILKQLRNIKYAQGEMLYGFENSVSLTLNLNIEPKHISKQADVFAREILMHRSKFDLKRFLGPYDQDWCRILHEAYVYDRCKCIYYGLNSNNIMGFPEDLVSFPGNVLLSNILKKRRFQYSTNDSQPMSLYVDVVSLGDSASVLKPIFALYPDVGEGITNIPNVVSYVNMKYESVLRGLMNAKTYLDSRKGTDGGTSLFEITTLSDEVISGMLSEESNPLINSFLNQSHNEFSFILPTSNSGPMGLRFNESIFISRALGFTSIGIKEGSNFFYTRVPRNSSADMFTRDEVYSVTGMTSEIMPFSDERIKEYLEINTYNQRSGRTEGGGYYTP